MEFNYDVINYVTPELLVLVPVLYFIGAMLKQSERVPDKYIPSVLGAVGIVLSLVYVIGNTEPCLNAVFSGITQGILCAGCAVYMNQLIKQGVSK